MWVLSCSWSERTGSYLWRQGRSVPVLLELQYFEEAPGLVDQIVGADFGDTSQLADLLMPQPPGRYAAGAGGHDRRPLKGPSATQESSLVGQAVLRRIVHLNLPAFRAASAWGAPLYGVRHAYKSAPEVAEAHAGDP